MVLQSTISCGMLRALVVWGLSKQHGVLESFTASILLSMLEDSEHFLDSRGNWKLHWHRPQIEKIPETLFHAASIGQWYSGCLDKQISQHLPTQLTWANILWKRVLFCLVEWSKWWCVWTQRFACRIDITEVASKKKCFSLPPTISNLGTLKSHLKAILVPNDSSKSGNFHASVLLGFA